MKKFSLLFFTAFVAGNNDRIKASKIFLLAFLFCCICNSGFAQVTITKATGGSAICGPTPGFTTLGDIIITETNNADFANGADQLTITPPPGWEFNGSACPTFSFTGSGNITAVVGGGCSNSAMTINITGTGTGLHDEIRIIGLQIQPLTPSAAPGSITASNVTGISGIALGTTDFGDVALNPGIISGNTTICITDSTTLSDPNIGGIWSSATTSVATIDPSTGVVSVVGPGTSNILYTIGSCAASVVLTINPNPQPIVGVHDICQNNCYIISDATVSGISLFTSTLVTVTNLGTPFGGTGTAQLCGVNAGAATVTYTLETGCFTTTTLTVNPIPQPIIDPTGTYQICAGSSEFLSDATSGGTWTSSVTTAATIDPNTGYLFAVGTPPGTTKISYTIVSTGCKTDTLITVNPVPLAITGADSVCVGSVTRLSDPTSGGTWSSSNTAFATVVSTTGVVTGVSGGVVTISYTLSTGCYATYSVTVNLVPDPIAGPTEVCESNMITLLETSSGGNWSSSNTAIATVDPVNGIVTGLVAGNDTILYTFSTGCSAIYPVKVDTLPAIITGSSVVCQMQCVQLSDATPGGTWSSSLPTFASAGATTGVVCGLQVGVVNISYIMPTGCFAIQNETINPLGPVVGPSSVCEGLTITLSDADPSNTPGTWSSSNTAAATVDLNTGIVTGISSTAGTPPGITVISFTNIAGCTATATITVNPSPGPITGADSVCKGLTVTLSDGTPGGTWSSNNTAIATVVAGAGNTGIVTAVITPGATAATDIISYTLPAGCSSTYTVTINPLPDPIIGPSSVCKGDSVTLVDFTPGGTWTTTDTLIAPVDSLLGIVKGVAPGFVTISYILPTSCLVTLPFTVNQITPVSGDTVVCSAATMTLSDATTGGTWSSGNTAIATVNQFTGVVTGVNPGGTVVITYSLPTGCFATYTVLVNPQPDPITGPSSVCVGQFITLQDATSGGTWTSSNTTATIDTFSGFVIGAAAGKDTITYTISTGCSITKTITVNALSYIITNQNDVCVGSAITVSDATPGGTWSSSNTHVATIGSLSGIVTGVSAGLDTISYTIIATGCTITNTIIVNPLPDTIRGSIPVCVNSMILLSDATSGGLWSVGNTSVATIDPFSGQLTGVGGGIAHVTYTLPTGCMMTDTVLINPLPANIIGPSDICIYSTATLSDADSLGTWTSSNTSILTIVDTSGVMTGVDTGVVTVIYTLPTGCQITKVITVRPLPVVTVTHPAIMCKGASDTLTANGGGPGGTYAWSPPTGLSCTSCQTTIASPTLSTTYTVTVTTQYGCQDTATTIVWVDSALNHLAVTGKADICAGECDLLVITGGVDSVYFWKPPTGLSCTNCDSTLACPVNTTTYWAIAVDFMGCKDSVSFTVTVHPLPVLVVDPNPTIVCKRSTTTVTVSGAGQGGHYTWTPNIFISCDTCATVVLSDTTNIVYEVTGTTIFGCKDSISVKVSVLDTNVNTISGDSIICIGKSVHLAAYSHSITGNLDVPTYMWIPTTGLDSPFINTPIATPTVTTIYTVIITENVCFKDTEHVQITVEPLPFVIITPVTATVIAGTAVQLLASAPNVIVSHFAWSPAATLSCDTCDNPIATPVQGTTTYSVTAISNFGCIGGDTMTIHLFCDNSQIFIPNTFTPNGDGINDRFYISGKGISTITRFVVFNRWGQLLFEAHNININDPGAGWDGTYKGYVLAPDVFIYELTGVCELGEPFSYKGDVSIVR